MGPFARLTLSGFGSYTALQWRAGRVLVPDIEVLKSLGEWGVTGILLLMVLLSFRERSEERKDRNAGRQVRLEQEKARLAGDLALHSQLVELTANVRVLTDRLPQICRSLGAGAGRGA